MTNKIIAYQGEPGANSHIACHDVYPDWEPLPCASFEDAFAALADNSATLGMIPIENSIAGFSGSCGFTSAFDTLPITIANSAEARKQPAIVLKDAIEISPRNSFFRALL